MIDAEISLTLPTDTHVLHIRHTDSYVWLEVLTIGYFFVFTDGKIHYQKILKINPSWRAKCLMNREAISRTAY